MEYFTAKKLDKKTESVISLLGTYWSEFSKLNQEGEKLIFPLRAVVIKKSTLERRNAYKHLHQLIFDGVFAEQDYRLIPTSFLFDINGRLFNPSLMLFEEELPIALQKERVYIVTPKIKTKLLAELLEKIKVGGAGLGGGETPLREFLNISLGLPEQHSYTQDYHYSELPKTLRMVEGWEQKNPLVAEQEAKLLSLISPVKDPLGHNTAFFLIPESSSPFIQIDAATKDYAIAAWCSHTVGDEIKGSPDDNLPTNAVIEFYGQDKELLGKRNFLHAQEGLNLMTDLLVIGGRIKTSGDLLGWYDFKNNIPAGKHVHSHILISFVGVKMPEKTTYFKIITGEKSYFAFISIFPLSKLPLNFLEQRQKKPEEFAQNSMPIFFYQKCKGLSGEKAYIKMNEELMKASFERGERKNELLKKALIQLDIFSQSLHKDLEKMMKNNSFSEKAVLLANSAFDARMLLSLAIRNKSAELKAKITKGMIKDYHIAQKMIQFLKGQNLFPEQVLLLLITNFRQYRDVKYYLKRDLELNHLRKMVQDNMGFIEKSSNVELKIEVYKWLLNFERMVISIQLTSGKTVNLKNIEEAFSALSSVYQELAEHIKQVSKLPTSEKIFQNKYLLYRNQSLFYNFGKIRFEAQVFSKTTPDPKMKEIYLMLKEFEKKLF